jgi:hypothetical protein
MRGSAATNCHEWSASRSRSSARPQDERDRHRGGIERRIGYPVNRAVAKALLTPAAVSLRP